MIINIQTNFTYFGCHKILKIKQFAWTYYNKFMKREQSQESKINIKTGSLGGELFDDELEMDNPENNFEKLMSMAPDMPGKELRNLIQSMSEHCSFQKNMIKKTSNIQVPRYVKTQIKRSEVFHDYQTIKNYTNFAKKKQHFETRKFANLSRGSSKASNYHEQESRYNEAKSMQKQNTKTKKSKKKHLDMSKPVSLLQFVQQKKNQMLMQDNILKTDQTNVSNILNDNKKREKIFEEALFLERLYDIEIQKLKKVGVSESTHNQVPEKFRGVEPKHIRISSQACINQEEYLRKKYVCKKRKLQFYGHARKIEQLSLKTKKKQIFGVLETIMKYNEANIHCQHNYFSQSNKNSKQQFQIFEEEQRIKKLFLKYSSAQSDNPEEMYKSMCEKQFINFLRDFNLQQKLETNLQIKNYVQKKRDEANKTNLSGKEREEKLFQREGKVRFYLFDFLEVLYLLASENFADKSVCNIHEFMAANIWPREQKVMPQLWIKLRKIKRSNKMTKFLKMLKFEEKAKNLFEKKLKKTAVSQFSVPVLDFNDMLEMAWQLKLFPTKISKKVLRFIYLYAKEAENGLNLSNFMDLLLIVALKFSDQEQTQDKLKWIVESMQ